MIPRLEVGKGVTGAVRYVLSEGKDRTGKYRTEPQGDAPRVAWLAGLNLGFAVETAADADLARRIMEFDALNQSSRTKPCTKDCVHLSLGWRKGEQPTREQMIEAAEAALASLGMANAKAIIVAHTDEDYPHLHIVASKINPDTGRAYDLKGDRILLSRWAEGYERDHSGGVICVRRAEANQLRAAIERRDAPAVLALMMQQRATMKPADLERALAKQIRRPLERAHFGSQVLALPEVVRLAERPGGPVTHYTTRAILQAEGQVLLSARALHGARRHRIDWQTARAIEQHPDFRSMSREQRNAFGCAIEAEGLALIDGQAGTGKSYTMAAIRRAYEAEGFAVIGLAPTNAVAQDMRGSGFAQADTIHGELFRLNNNRASPWTHRTVLMVDEAAMIDTLLLAQLARRAEEARAKLILIGDDRQLSSIDRGGMFGALKDAYGAAALTQVRRQHKQDDRRAAELMAEGNFSAALAIYDDRRAIHWQHNQEAARAALVEQWAKDSAADPARSRFVFAYTNADVDRLNADLRQVRQARGELGAPQRFATKHGPADFADGDRIQLTGTDKKAGLINGAAGTVQRIEGDRITVKLDGRAGETVTIDAATFKDFRHGYAGTIYKGQGRTLDETYLYHSEHWRASSGYVALTRHRHKVDIFTARDVVEDVRQLARQMARVDDRRAASRFHQPDGPIAIERQPTAQLPKIELPKRDEAARAAPEPAKPRPPAWEQSAGMVAQQRSALRAAQAADRAQVEAFGPVAAQPQPKPRYRVPANSNPISAPPAPPPAARQEVEKPTPAPAPPVPVTPAATPRQEAPAIETVQAPQPPVPRAPPPRTSAEAEAAQPYAPIHPSLPRSAAAGAAREVTQPAPVPAAPAVQPRQAVPAAKAVPQPTPAPAPVEKPAPTPAALPTRTPSAAQQTVKAAPQEVRKPAAATSPPPTPVPQPAARLDANAAIPAPAPAAPVGTPRQEGPANKPFEQPSPSWLVAALAATRPVQGSATPTPAPSASSRAAPASGATTPKPPPASDPGRQPAAAATVQARTPALETAKAAPPAVPRQVAAPIPPAAPTPQPAGRQEAGKEVPVSTPAAPVQKREAPAMPAPASVPAPAPAAKVRPEPGPATAATPPAPAAPVQRQPAPLAARQPDPAAQQPKPATPVASASGASRPFTPATKPAEKSIEQRAQDELDAARELFERRTAHLTRDNIARANSAARSRSGGRGGRRR